MKSILVSLIILVCIIGCSTNKQLVTLDKEPNEAIVAGNIKIYYNDEDVTEQSLILFNETLFGTYSYNPDQGGTIITKLPVGECHISRVMYKNFYYNISKKKSGFTVNNDSNINYIGDLTIKWFGDKDKMSGMFGLVGAVLDEVDNDGVLHVFAEDNLDQFKTSFYSNYDTDLEFNNLTLDFPPPGEFDLSIVKYDPSSNPDYLHFQLTNDRDCYGELCKIKKTNLYVRDGKKLYVFKRKDLQIINDFSGNDVTEETLKQTEFEKINFNSYEIIYL